MFLSLCFRSDWRQFNPESDSRKYCHVQIMYHSSCQAVYAHLQAFTALYLYAIRRITVFNLQLSHSFLFSFLWIGTPVSRSVAACGSPSSPLGWTTSLPDAFGIFPWWVAEEGDTHCGGALTAKCSPGQGSVGGGMKMGKRNTSSWKSRALEFFPWTSFQHQCLLPKPWRSALGDREEMSKCLLILKYLEN